MGSHEKGPALKRGLEDISHLFVSSPALPTTGKEPILAVACDPSLPEPLKEAITFVERLRPALVERGPGVRFLLTEGSQRVDGSHEQIVAYLQDTDPSGWGQALEWCDRFVMVLPVTRKALGRYCRFLEELGPQRRARTSFYWAPAGDLTAVEAGDAGLLKALNAVEVRDARDFAGLESTLRR